MSDLKFIAANGKYEMRERKKPNFTHCHMISISIVFATLGSVVSAII